MNSDLEALLRQNFLSFARKALRDTDGIKLGREPYLQYLACELGHFISGDTPRVVINLPPGHLKTSLGSVCLAAWLLAHDPATKLIIVSHTEHLSKSIARKIRTILQSGWFKEVFPTRLKKGHTEVTDFGTTSGGGVFVTSFGASFTGRRADVIIVDDPHDIRDQTQQIEATIEVFGTVLLSRLNDRRAGRVLVIAHRVNERDLSAHLKLHKKWKHVVLPLIATADHTYRTAGGTWIWRAGDLLRPESFDSDDLDDLRENSINPDFEMLYQQDVASLALPAINANHFPSFIADSPSFGPIVLSVDAGVSDRPRSSYSVIQVWRVTPTDYLLLDQFREQTDFVGLREAIRRYRKILRPTAILIERAANGHALIADLVRKHGQLIWPIDLDGRSKSARLYAHGGTIIARRIRLPAQAPWRDCFVREFCEFPNGKFTDQVDATTQFLDHADQFAGMSTTPHGGPGIASDWSGRMVKAAAPGGNDRAVIVALRYGRPIGSRSISAGPVMHIKTEVKY